MILSLVCKLNLHSPRTTAFKVLIIKLALISSHYGSKHFSFLKVKPAEDFHIMKYLIISGALKIVSICLDLTGENFN
jgi:hypothetical protein